MQSYQVIHGQAVPVTLHVCLLPPDDTTVSAVISSSRSSYSVGANVLNLKSFAYNCVRACVCALNM